MNRRTPAFVFTVAVAVLFPAVARAGPADATEPDGEPKHLIGCIENKTEGTDASKSIYLRVRHGAEVEGIWVTQGEIKPVAQSLGQGDCIVADTVTRASRKEVVDLSLQSVAIDRTTRLCALLAALAVALAAASLVCYRELRIRGIRALIIGMDHRYSNSQVQIVIWFVTLITSYMAALLLRGWYGGSAFLKLDIPTNLLLISGLSGLTFVGAKAITSSQLDAAPKPDEVKPAADKPRLVQDLFCDDGGRPDLGDFQMLVLTSLAVIVYVVQIYGYLGMLVLRTHACLPDVDSTILAAFGLGQGAYLGKKYVNSKVTT